MPSLKCGLLLETLDAAWSGYRRVMIVLIPATQERSRAAQPCPIRPGHKCGEVASSGHTRKASRRCSTICWVSRSGADYRPRAPQVSHGLLTICVCRHGTDGVSVCVVTISSRSRRQPKKTWRSELGRQPVVNQKAIGCVCKACSGVHTRPAAWPPC